jgi:hypothetical protein
VCIGTMECEIVTTGVAYDTLDVATVCAMGGVTVVSFAEIVPVAERRFVFERNLLDSVT